MPRVNPCIWELARFHPDFIWVMFLIMMYSRFLAQFGGRNHHPKMLSISPILPQLLTIMSDTQSFPFFSRCDLLRMFAYHGATLHLVGAFCSPTPDRRIMWRIKHLILGRMISKIVSKPEIASCFKRYSSALQTYPRSIPISPLHVEISNIDIVCNLKTITIWQMLWLCTILPEAKAAILDISSESLSHDQMKKYDKLYMIMIFRHLFKSRNRVFILLCKYFHSIKKYEKQRRSDGSIDILRKRIEKKLLLQMASHDFKVYRYYLQFLFTKLLPSELSMNMILDSLKILEKFFQTMSLVHGSFSNIFNHYQSPTSNFFGLSDILNQTDPKKLLEQLNATTQQREKSLVVCMSPPNHSFHKWLFLVLQRANSLSLSPHLQEYLESCVSGMESDTSCEVPTINNRFARMINLVIRFAKWIQSDDPHHQFIIDCVSFMKATGTTKHADLARFLDLSQFKPKALIVFSDLFDRFRRYADPSMGCSEPTEPTLLCFFDQMHMVFSNELFLRTIQEFLKTFESVQRSCGFDRTEGFLNTLAKTTQLHPIIKGICYFRLTNCDSCLEYLDSNNDYGLCPDCRYHRQMNEQIEANEEKEMEEERRFFARGPGLNRRW